MAGKLAARKLQRGEDGRLHVITYDVQTGQPISDMTGYTLYTPDTTPQDLNITPSTPSATNPAAPELNGQGEQDPQSIAEDIVNSIKDGSGETNITGMLDSKPRSAGNNYGYIDKPMVTSIMGMLGGPVGVAGKAVNAMINHNNVQAANAARSVVGLGPISTATTVRNTISGNDYANGLVANAKIGNETYAVGFEAVTPDGRTTLTPEEARRRSLTTGQKITEATPEEVEKDVQAVEALGNAQKGVVGKAKDAVGNVVKGAVNSVLGREKTAPKSMVKDSAVAQTQEVLGTTKPSGFAAVSPTYTKGIERSTSVANYDRTNLSPSLNAALDALGQTVPGINVNSGHRSVSHNASVGGAKNSRHISGTAVDLDIRDLSDEQKRAALEAAITNNVKGVGLYPGGRTMHIDTRKNPTTWGFNPAATYNSLRTPDGQIDVEATVAAAPEWAQNSIRSLYGAGTSNVHPTNGPMPTSRDVALSTPERTPQTSMQAIDNMMESRPTIAEGVVSGVYGNLGRFGQAYMDQGQVTPAQSLRTEFGPKDQIGVDQIDSMARAFAGELSPDVLDGIAKQDPAALAELANMTSAVVNRGFSSKYAGDIESVVNDPTQVNSMAPGALGVTDANYGKYGAAIKDGIRGVIDGNIAPTADTFSHWENTTTPPGWTDASTYSERVGSHNYHSLMDEYSPSQGFKDNYSEKVNKSFMDSTPEFDTSWGYSDKIGSFNNTGKTGINSSISKSMSTRTKDDDVGGVSYSERNARDSQRNSEAGSMVGSRYDTGVGFAGRSNNSGISSRTGSGKEKDDRGVTKGTSSSGGLNKSISSSMSTRSKDDNVGSSKTSSNKNSSSKSSPSNAGSDKSTGPSKSTGGGNSSVSGRSGSGKDKDDKGVGSSSSSSGGKSSGSSGKSGGNATW